MDCIDTYLLDNFKTQKGGGSEIKTCMCLAPPCEWLNMMHNAMPATESNWRHQIVSVRDKNRLAQLAEIYTRPSSVQCGDWRAAETRHSSQVGHSLPACVTNTSSRVRDIRIISMWRCTCIQCHLGAHARLTSHASRESVLYSWRRALGGDNKHRCLHVVWYRLLTVCQHFDWRLWNTFQPDFEIEIKN